MDINGFLSRLGGIRKTGSNQWISKCPSHEDKSPSLSVKECDDGRILIHCFACCSPQNIVDSMGIRLSDLFPTQCGYHAPIKNRPNYRELWIVAIHYFWVLIIATSDLEKNKKLSISDLELVKKSRVRLINIMGVIND